MYSDLNGHAEAQSKDILSERARTGIEMIPQDLSTHLSDLSLRFHPRPGDSSSSVGEMAYRPVLRPRPNSEVVARAMALPSFWSVTICC